MKASKLLPSAAGIIFGFVQLSCVPQSRPFPENWEIGTTSHGIPFGGDGRSYLVHVPRSRPLSRFRKVEAYPLVILLHGSGAEGATIRAQSNFDSLADQYHVVAVYPDGATGPFGLRSDWNAGECCGAPARQNVDDVGFIQAVIAEVSSHIPIDARRIYIAGFSDGGRMALHMACATASNFAAVGAVAGSLVDSRCAPSRPIPVAIVHGTADQSVPFLDPALTPPRRQASEEMTALPPSARFWAVANGCSGLVTRTIAPAITRAFFRSCTGADVIMYTVIGGTHAWPGGLKDGADGNQPAAGLDASRVLLRFFLSHVM